MNASVRLRRICLAQIAAGNSAWVEQLRDRALTQITAGNGQLSALKTGTVNGRTFERTTILTNVDVADIAQSALDEAATGDTGAEGMTVPDFSR